MYVIALKSLNNPDEAEDIVSEVWVRAVKHVSELSAESYRGWLKKVLMNLIVDRYRRKTHQAEVPLGPAGNDGDPLPKHPSTEASPERQVQSAELRRAIADCVEGLNEIDRAVFLAWAAGVSMREFATETGHAHSSLGSRQTRARVKVRICVEARIGRDGWAG